MNKNFIKGDLVELTQEAIRQKLDGPTKNRVGFVEGVSRDGKCFYVRFEGKKSKHRFAGVFLKIRKFTASPRMAPVKTKPELLIVTGVPARSRTMPPL